MVDQLFLKGEEKIFVGLKLKMLIEKCFLRYVLSAAHCAYAVKDGVLKPSKYVKIGDINKRSNVQNTQIFVA